MTNSFDKHQRNIDHIAEENEINWLFGDPINTEDAEELEDDYEPTDLEMQQHFGTPWHDWI